MAMHLETDIFLVTLLHKWLPDMIESMLRVENDMDPVELPSVKYKALHVSNAILCLEMLLYLHGFA